MSIYFALAEFQIQRFDRTEARFTETIPGLPSQLALGSDWRRLCDTNLVWLERTLQKAIQGPVEDIERLGQACLFFFHLKALHEGGPECDLRPDLFGQLESEF